MKCLKICCESSWVYHIKIYKFGLILNWFSRCYMLFFFSFFVFYRWFSFVIFRECNVQQTNMILFTFWFKSLKAVLFSLHKQSLAFQHRISCLGLNKRKSPRLVPHRSPRRVTYTKVPMPVSNESKRLSCPGPANVGTEGGEQVRWGWGKEVGEEWEKEKKRHTRGS